MLEYRVSRLASRAALVALAALPVWAMAGDAKGPASYGAQDPAAINCKLMTAMYEASVTGTERQFFDFAQGYFAGRSAAVPAANQRRLSPAGPERAKQFTALLKFCEENPKATFADAVVALWNALQGPAGPTT